jgi:hypothetical protein
MYMDYRKIYNDICQRGRDQLEERKLNKKLGTEYYEGHHIIPRCLGGEGTGYTWNHENITPLTAREHFIAHKLLCLMYPENKKLVCALYLMMKDCIRSGKLSICSRDYERVTKEHSLARKILTGDLHHNSRPVNQYDITTGTFIASYISAQEAADATWIVHIPDVCRGERRSAGGFYWQYQNTDQPTMFIVSIPPPPERKNPRLGKPGTMLGVTGSMKVNAVSINKYDIVSGDLLEVYGSVAEAATSAGVDRSGITRVCKGKKKTAGGFYWKYAEL